MKTWIPYTVGYVFAVFAGHFAISWLVNKLWTAIGEDPLTKGKHRPGWWLPKVIGLVERSLYVGAMSMGAPQFVGVWLAMKIAGQWSVWKEGIREGDRFITGASIFSIFLVGNGLSIGYSMVGCYLIEELPKNLAASIAVPLAVLAGTLGLWCVTNRYEKG